MVSRGWTVPCVLGPRLFTASCGLLSLLDDQPECDFQPTLFDGQPIIGATCKHVEDFAAANYVAHERSNLEDVGADQENQQPTMRVVFPPTKNGFLPPPRGEEDDDFLPPSRGEEAEGFLPPQRGEAHNGILPPPRGEEDGEGNLQPSHGEEGQKKPSEGNLQPSHRDDGQDIQFLGSDDNHNDPGSVPILKTIFYISKDGCYLDVVNYIQALLPPIPMHPISGCNIVFFTNILLALHTTLLRPRVKMKTSLYLNPSTTFTTRPTPYNPHEGDKFHISCFIHSHMSYDDEPINHNFTSNNSYGYNGNTKPSFLTATSSNPIACFQGESLNAMFTQHDLNQLEDTSVEPLIQIYLHEQDTSKYLANFHLSNLRGSNDDEQVQEIEIAAIAFFEEFSDAVEADRRMMEMHHKWLPSRAMFDPG